MEEAEPAAEVPAVGMIPLFVLSGNWRAALFFSQEVFLSPEKDLTFACQVTKLFFSYAIY